MQIPELMKTVGAMQQQVAEMLGQVGSAAALPTTLDGPNTSKLCKSLLEVRLPKSAEARGKPPERCTRAGVEDWLHRRAVCACVLHCVVGAGKGGGVRWR